MSDESKTPEAPEEASPAQAAAEPATEPQATEPQPAAAPAPVQAQRRLTRRPEGKILGGVCTGLAAFTGVDPVLVRVGFVLAAILGGGTGVLAYIVLWLVMPMAPEGGDLPPVRSFDANSTWRWTAIGLIFAAVIVLSHNIWHFHASLFWGLALLGIGVALWSREMHGRNGHTPPPARPVPPATPASAPPRPATPTQPISGGGGAPLTATRPLPPVPAPRRPPSVLGRVIVGAGALAVGIAVLLDNLNAVHMTPRIVFSILLFIVGAGLIVGAWWGRARWLVFPGIVLALILGGVSVLPANIHGSAGNIEYTPTSLDDVRTSYHHGAGNMQIDLTKVKFDSQPRTLRVSQGFGNLEIDLPDGVPVQAQSHVRGGDLEVLGHESHGWDITDAEYSGGDAKLNLGLLTIRTDLGFGKTEIKRGNSPGVATQHVKVDIGPGHVKVDAP